MGLAERSREAGSRTDAQDGADRTPIRLYIAALGGEGGGVLTSWIVAAATAEGWPVQSTSIPGVAQRTGATTYYVEILPRRWGGPQEDRPIFALTPTPGFVDVVVATELLEAGRAIEHGYVAPERTTVIASTHRIYTIHEKSAMADERLPGDRVLKAIDLLAARSVVADLAALAREADAIVSSVALGAVAGAGVLPLARDRFEAVLRDSAVAVEANLRGFAAGYDAVVGRPAAGDDDAAPPAPETLPHGPRASRGFPAEVDEFVRHGITRLTEYQDASYADRYVRGVERVLAAEREAAGEAGGCPVTREAARYLALWMAYEDIIRVAALKTSRDRWQAIDRANPRGERDTLHVTEFLKPGVEEFASVMPPRFGRWIIEAARRRGKLDAYNVGMRLRSTSVFGFLLMRLLARLRFWRPRTFRFHEEMAAAEAWLDLVVEATRIDREFGAEVVECARIRKGYGSTHRRGAANFAAIMTRVVRPAILDRRSAASDVAEMRALALSDPEGTAMLEAVEQLPSAPLAAAGRLDSSKSEAGL